jgi:hypothetical protein
VHAAPGEPNLLRKFCTTLMVVLRAVDFNIECCLSLETHLSGEFYFIFGLHGWRVRLGSDTITDGCCRIQQLKLPCHRHTFGTSPSDYLTPHDAELATRFSIIVIKDKYPHQILAANGHVGPACSVGAALSCSALELRARGAGLIEL